MSFALREKERGGELKRAHLCETDLAMEHLADEILMAAATDPQRL